MKYFYLIMTMFLTLVTWSCKTKKTIYEERREERTISVIEEEHHCEEKREEKQQEKEKDVIEAWSKIVSDSVVIEDKASGKRMVIYKPVKEVERKQQKEKESIQEKKEEVAEEIRRSENEDQQIAAESKDTSETKAKQPVWFFLIAGAIVAGFGYLVLKRFKII